MGYRKWHAHRTCTVLHDLTNVSPCAYTPRYKACSCVSVLCHHTRKIRGMCWTVTQTGKASLANPLGFEWGRKGTDEHTKRWTYGVVSFTHNIQTCFSILRGAQRFASICRELLQCCLSFRRFATVSRPLAPSN